jgi:hypothetical protein
MRHALIAISSIALTGCSGHPTKGLVAERELESDRRFIDRS